MQFLSLLCAFLSGSLLTACVSQSAGSSVKEAQGVQLHDHFDLTFQRPVQFSEIPGKPEHYVVVEQPGRIVTVRRESGSTTWSTSEFLTVDVRGGSFGGSEQGLLGVAFHPEFAQNRKYYVSYIEPEQSGTVIAERLADTSLLRDAGLPQRTLLEVAQPYGNHNGGTIGFGPDDGYLYIGLGDGGSAGDPGNRAQDPGELLGKFLRIDVDVREAGKEYGIPSDNPFVDSAAYRPEIWALGVRNPWKWHFHPLTGELYAGDVGQSSREEVTRVPKGANLGWKMWEGERCYSEPCAREGMTFPVLDLGRSEAVSVTGGAFYTADTTSGYYGGYVFGDYGSGTLWVLREEGDGSRTRERAGSVTAVSSFDSDSQGRVFATSLRDGTIMRVDFDADTDDN